MSQSSQSRVRLVVFEVTISKEVVHIGNGSLRLGPTLFDSSRIERPYLIKNGVLVTAHSVEVFSQAILMPPIAS